MGGRVSELSRKASGNTPAPERDGLRFPGGVTGRVRHRLPWLEGPLVGADPGKVRVRRYTSEIEWSDRVGRSARHGESLRSRTRLVADAAVQMTIATTPTALTVVEGEVHAFIPTTTGRRSTHSNARTATDR